MTTPRCNLERLGRAMQQRGIDGLVITLPYNVYYLSGFNATAHKADEPRPYAVVVSRQAIDRPVLIVADYYLGGFATRPTWIADIRPFRAVMMPLDLAPSAADIERFIPERGGDAAWVGNARGKYAFDMGTSVKGALADLGLQGAKLGFDDVETERLDDAGSHRYHGVMLNADFTLVTDQLGALVCGVYVDLNQIAAQEAATPEASTHTSASLRIRGRAARQAGGGPPEELPEQPMR